MYWTTKVKGKTVSRLLKPEEAQLYKAWVANRKTLDRTVKHMLEVSRDVAAVVLKGENPFINQGAEPEPLQRAPTNSTKTEPRRAESGLHASEARLKRFCMWTGYQIRHRTRPILMRGIE